MQRVFEWKRKIHTDRREKLSKRRERESKSNTYPNGVSVGALRERIDTASAEQVGECARSAAIAGVSAAHAIVRQSERKANK